MWLVVAGEVRWRELLKLVPDLLLGEHRVVPHCEKLRHTREVVRVLERVFVLLCPSSPRPRTRAAVSRRDARPEKGVQLPHLIRPRRSSQSSLVTPVDRRPRGWSRALQTRGSAASQSVASADIAGRRSRCDRKHHPPGRGGSRIAAIDVAASSSPFSTGALLRDPLHTRSGSPPNYTQRGLRGTVCSACRGHRSRRRQRSRVGDPCAPARGLGRHRAAWIALAAGVVAALLSAFVALRQATMAERLTQVSHNL